MNESILNARLTDIKSIENTQWENKDNNSFYEEISIEAAVENSVLGGLEDGFDLDLIYPEIQRAKSILEVGAGYGRVINYLLKKAYKGKIFAIERSRKLYEYLIKSFSQEVKIINADLVEFRGSQKFDLILWMFSGISDFPENRQLSALATLTRWLSVQGKIAVDVFRHDIKPANAINSYHQTYMVQDEGYTLMGYLPSIDEMRVYATKVNMTISKIISYETPTHSQRFLYLLEKKRENNLDNY